MNVRGSGPTGDRTSAVVATVIVPARDSASTLTATLDGIARQEVDGAFEAIVVDNGSLDHTPELAESHRLHPALVRRTRGAGVAAARNSGAGVARGPVLAFIDADCVPTPDWLASGLRALADADLAQGRIHPEAGKPVGPFDRTLGVVSEYGMYETANLFVRRDLFERLGGFPDVAASARRPFGEDVLFAWAARRAGARTCFASDALVHHAIFPGDLSSYVVERARRWRFPQLVAQVPELRDTFLYHRVFLNSYTAAFDAACIGVVAAVLTRSVRPLVLTAPYVSTVRRKERHWRGSRYSSRRAAAAMVLADAVSCGALLFGSIAAKTVVM